MGINSRNNGVVANVVTSAMSTIIANSVGGMIPKIEPNVEDNQFHQAVVCCGGCSMCLVLMTTA